DRIVLSLLVYCSLFFAYFYIVGRDLHSFPTRRSSDLFMAIMFILIPCLTRRIGLKKQKNWLQILVWWLKGVITLEEGFYLLGQRDRKSTRLNSSHVKISYAVFCLKKKKINSESNKANG